MADIVFNCAKGREAYYGSLPGTSDAIIAVPLEASGLVGDSTMVDYDTLAAVLAGASNEQTTMGRETLTGVTVIVPDLRAVCAVDVRGGGSGTRETDALAPENLVDAIDALVLSGGSVYGLAAADGVAAAMGGEGRGFALIDLPGVPRSPVIPAAILYDLANGGAKAWGDAPPYNTLGRRAAACNQHLACVFRDVDLKAASALVQPVDLRIMRHDRREPLSLEADRTCRVSQGTLHCEKTYAARTWRAWVVPERIAAGAGAAALEAAVERGLAVEQSAALAPAD